METYYINGYRIAARSYAQAQLAARILKRGEYPFDWPGERDYNRHSRSVDETAHYRAVG